MPARLRDEIKQRRPFPSPAEEAFLNVWKTADTLQRQVSEILKPLGLTPTQYHVLRILRGAGEGSRTCTEIAERMVTRDPDVTRLLDRLQARGLIVRERSLEDRRVVQTRITKAGLRLLEEADGPMVALHSRQFQNLTGEQVSELIAALEAVRSEQG